MDSTILAIVIVSSFLPTIIDQISQHLYHRHLEKQFPDCKNCPYIPIDLEDIE